MTIFVPPPPRADPAVYHPRIRITLRVLLVDERLKSFASLYIIHCSKRLRCTCDVPTVKRIQDIIQLTQPTIGRKRRSRRICLSFCNTAVKSPLTDPSNSGRFSASENYKPSTNRTLWIVDKISVTESVRYLEVSLNYIMSDLGINWAEISFSSTMEASHISIYYKQYKL